MISLSFHIMHIYLYVIFVLLSEFAVTHFWECMKPLGVGPCPRRRQSCCVVGSKMFLFGGTSPKDNYEDMTPPEDDAFSEESTDRRLKDHNDLHVLDFGFSRKRVETDKNRGDGKGALLKYEEGRIGPCHKVHGRTKPENAVPDQSGDPKAGHLLASKGASGFARSDDITKQDNSKALKPHWMIP
ncbi:Kelch domain-containing protein 3 [Chionoecetes opilio]|uniref:Kelch domain-containing protein 3 n=1 Tax=Chionoecetes opilio TaxID=41210 RepID=A0A8J4YYN8_CHIOP|nr:Kelch domain-containing protein 3 [Chionoecetes opilio]